MLQNCTKNPQKTFIKLDKLCYLIVVRFRSSKSYGLRNYGMGQLVDITVHSRPRELATTIDK